jgi:transcriptional regulator of aromatic amino acid metabolism
MEFVGRSSAIAHLRAQIAKIAPSHAGVFIVGESGVGKEVVARKIHQLSGRRPDRFIAKNCANFGETLIESELFGLERGAFTGATDRSRGIFEQAEGGTVFLDEITEMKLELQAKLLRPTRRRATTRSGARSASRCDVRSRLWGVRIVGRGVRERRVKIFDGLGPFGCASRSGFDGTFANAPYRKDVLTHLRLILTTRNRLR